MTVLQTFKSFLLNILNENPFNLEVAFEFVGLPPVRESFFLEGRFKFGNTDELTTLDDGEEEVDINVQFLSLFPSSVELDVVSGDGSPDTVFNSLVDIIVVIGTNDVAEGVRGFVNFQGNLEGLEMLEGLDDLVDIFVMLAVFIIAF